VSGLKFSKFSSFAREREVYWYRERVKGKKTHLTPPSRILTSNPTLFLPIFDGLRSFDLVLVDLREVVLGGEVFVV